MSSFCSSLSPVRLEKYPLRLSLESDSYCLSSRFHKSFPSPLPTPSKYLCTFASTLPMMSAYILRFARGSSLDFSFFTLFMVNSCLCLNSLISEESSSVILLVSNRASSNDFSSSICSSLNISAFIFSSAVNIASIRSLYFGHSSMLPLKVGGVSRTPA